MKKQSPPQLFHKVQKIKSFIKSSHISLSLSLSKTYTHIQHPFFLHRQITTTRPSTTHNLLNRQTYIRSHNRHIAHKPSHRQEEIAKQHRNAIPFHQEAQKRPPEKNKEYPCRKRRCTFDLLPPREEQQRLLWSDDQRQSNEEENLWFCCCCVSTKRGRKKRGEGGGMEGRDGGMGRERGRRHTLPMASLAKKRLADWSLRGGGKEWVGMLGCAPIFSYMARSKNMNTPMARKNPPVIEFRCVSTEHFFL